MTWISVPGVLQQGYRVASAPSAEYPYGTLEKQKPLFEALGFDLDDYVLGTLNVDITPANFQIVAPEFTFHQVEWTDLHPPEDFSFSRCQVRFETVDYDGWVYYPHPETKLRHFQKTSLLWA